MSFHKQSNGTLDWWLVLAAQLCTLPQRAVSGGLRPLERERRVQSLPRPRFHVLSVKSGQPFASGHKVSRGLQDHLLNASSSCSAGVCRSSSRRGKAD